MSKRPEIHFRPLEGWPRAFAGIRKVSPFKNHSIDTNLALLTKQLRELETSAAVIQTAHEERDISPTTGRPRADRPPEHPGVIVAADTKFGSLKWVCDDCVEWQDNIRAIALTLERLRLADRYGVTRRGEQYSGWKMLPGPITASASGQAAAGMTVEAAARFMAEIAGVPAEKVIAGRGWFENAYRDAVKKLHPDKGGSDAQWKRLEEAKTLLDSLHNRK